MGNKNDITGLVDIERRIFIIRDQKVMLDFHLAGLYGVPTKRLNEQVKRNLGRFPSDFMFQLTNEEVVAICDHLPEIKFSYKLPHAFTEHGVAMLSSVLRSERAVQMNIFIIRAFVKLREALVDYKDLTHKVSSLEHEQEKQGEMIDDINQAVIELIGARVEPTDPIGFKVKSANMKT